MTDCIAESMPFSSLGPKAILADFNGRQLTTDAGTLLLRAVADRIGLFDALDAAIPDPRDPEMITHHRRAMIAQRVVAIALGYEDLNDHQALRADPALHLAAGRAPDPATNLASPPTLCRLEDRVGREALLKASEVLVDRFIASHATAPEALILDFDATDDPTHGQQEGRFFHGYYDHRCFLPLYAFCGEELLVAYPRPSKIDAARHARAVLKLPARKLRAAWPEVKLTIRGDSGFCRWRTMRRCDTRGIGHVLGLARDARPERRAIDWTSRAERQLRHTGRAQRLFGSLGYQAGSWGRPRRVIVKAEHNAGGPNPRLVVTNVPGDPEGLYDGVYCPRCEMENRIEEQQLGLFADRTSCHRFLANQLRLLLSSAAYVLVQALRREALAGTELAGAQVTTIRLKLFKVAARVMVSTRRVVFHLAGGYPYQAAFAAAYRGWMGDPVAIMETG